MNEDKQKLVERIEAATGPDRELDAAIATHLGWADVRWNSFHGNYWSHDLSDDLVVMLPIPEWSASIDAAMTLVPDDHTVQLSDWDHPILRAKGQWQAIILPLGARGGMKEYTFTNRCDHAATLPLAICAAALSARAPQS